MPEVVIISVPEGTKTFYITALSLCPAASAVSVTWVQGSATFGATFVGPTSNYVLADSVFDLPVIVQEGGEMPEELSISFEFEGRNVEQQSGNEPELVLCGPAGSSSKVMISGYATHDEEKKAPTTVTIMFKGEMRGLRR